MNKRKKLGQHFLKSKTIAKSVASNAGITRNDVILEVGTGHGILIPYICKNAKKVYSIERDKNLHISAKSNFNYSNLILEHGDVLIQIITFLFLFRIFLIQKVDLP